MSRMKKESHPFSIKMDSAVYSRLEVYCEQSGQSKTVAIERAVKMFIDDYDKKMHSISDRMDIEPGEHNG